MSSYEKYIEDLLRKEKIKYIREKTYDDLKDGRYRFDFYLPYVDGGVLVECDGEQHFRQVKAFQTRQDFLRQQEHDRQKNSYCLSYKIKLYRIPYWEIKRIQRTSDIFTEKYLVKSKWHNDLLKVPK